MRAGAAGRRGFLHPAYPASLEAWGRVQRLPRSGAWLLEQAIPGADATDARAGYRYCFAEDWPSLAADLDEVTGPVSIVAVTDPFADALETDLRRAFPDHLEPYKASYVIDLHDPAPSAHHQARARKALGSLDLDVLPEPVAWLDDWERLYDAIRRRFDIVGLPAFSRAAFAGQLGTPGCVAIRATAGGVAVSMSVYYVVGQVAYSHLVASDEAGYRVAASYAVHARAIDHFASSGLRWLDLGSGAGRRADEGDGLSTFKRGWSSTTRETYVGGRVIDRVAYDELTRRAGVSPSRYFPAYRAGLDG